MADKPDLQRTRRDSGPLEVVSEQHDDGTYEIKVQSKEIPVQRLPTPEEVEGKGLISPRGGGNAASWAGLLAVVVLLVVGGWLLFVSPRGSGREPPVVAPPPAGNRPMLQGRSRPLPDGEAPLLAPVIERSRSRIDRIRTDTRPLADVGEAQGPRTDMGTDVAQAPPGEPGGETVVPTIEGSQPTGTTEAEAGGPGGEDTAMEQPAVQVPSGEDDGDLDRPGIPQPPRGAPSEEEQNDSTFADEDIQTPRQEDDSEEDEGGTWEDEEQEEGNEILPSDDEEFLPE